VSRDLVNHKKMVIVRNSYQKRKEHDEISKIFNFEVTDVKVRHFTVILMFKKLPRLIGKKAAGWQALPSSIHLVYEACARGASGSENRVFLRHHPSS